MKSAIIFFFAIITCCSAQSQSTRFESIIEEIKTAQTVTAAEPAPRYQLPLPNDNPDAEHLMFQKYVKVPAGTQVMFKTNEKIPAARLVDGQMIRLKVVSDVVVDGKVIIRTNTQAVGIARIESPMSAQSVGQVIIEVMNVADVQGKTITLNSDPNYINGTYPGMGADVPLGRVVTASVQNNIEVSLK